MRVCYGRREMTERRVGILVPSSNAVVEPELLALLPRRVTAHFARVGGGGRLITALHEMEKDLEPEVCKLAQVCPHAIGFACTSGSFYSRTQFAHELSETLSRTAGVPATTATTAGIWRLRELGAQKIVFCSPYQDDIHERGISAFRAAGFDVVPGGSLGLETNAEIGALSEDDVAALVRRSWVRDADALFLSCTSVRTVALLSPLSEELQRPMVSSNAALADHLVVLADAAEIEVVAP